MSENKTEGKKEKKLSAEEAAKAAEYKKANAKKPQQSKGKKAAGGLSFAVEKERPRGPQKTPRLKKLYDDKLVAELQKELGLGNRMEVPRLSKVVVNCTTKDALENRKTIENITNELAIITGQKGKVTNSKKAIAAFKLRENQPLGVAVTLRRAKMFEFVDRLVNIALPRVRDFKGVNTKSFDGRGNYSLGVTEQIIFPEINYDDVEKIRGMSITFVTTAKNNKESRALLTALGMPFKK